MDVKKILSVCDHTLLLQTATWDEIKQICDDAIKYGCASVCIPPCYIKAAREYMGKKMAITTVIGFPNGNVTTDTKVYETKDAVTKGVDEVDMVINIGKLLHGDTDYVRNEIRQIVDLAHASSAIVKVIIETCYLNDEQKVLACHLSEEAGADFVKTSTGYGSKGCTIEDLKLMRAAVSPAVRVKGSGGIRDLDTVLQARAAGASRCGVSATEKIMAEAEARYAEGTLREL